MCVCMQCVVVVCVICDTWYVFCVMCVWHVWWNVCVCMCVMCGEEGVAQEEPWKELSLSSESLLDPSHRVLPFK